MKRRDFLKAAAFAGLAVVTPWSLTSRKAKAAEGYDGLFFINVNAGGGWDPTSHCDPKGRVDENQEEPINMGSWDFTEPKLRKVLEDRIPVQYAGRKSSASTATGVTQLHLKELETFLNEALSL